ncbi:MAG: hypothetical protein OEQ39_27155, partial [Gammaproteobacteria bacterium]|nr:hypothetical protein [Gammaproteobacteria bacterium]
MTVVETGGFPPDRTLRTELSCYFDNAWRTARLINSEHCLSEELQYMHNKIQGRCCFLNRTIDMNFP